MKISEYKHPMVFPIWTSLIKTDTVCYHLIMPQRLVFAVWNYKKKQGFINVLTDDDNFRLLAVLECMLC